MIRKFTDFLGILSLLLFLTACGAQRKNFIAKTYHNTTTHYNYYYNGQVKWKEGVQQINAAFRVPLQGYIPVLYVGKEEDAKTYGSNFEEAIKKCETAILKHPNSRWIKNCRFLIGRSWFYKQNYILAIQNLEFVVKTWPEAKIIPDVYIWLVKSYYKNGNRLTAQKILDKELKGKKLSKRQIGEIAMIQAQMLLEDKNYDEVIRVLESNEKVIKGKGNKARVHFLLGQLYADKGTSSKALAHFKIVSKMNTDYEFVFQAKIKIARILVERGGQEDSKELARLLKKMLRDEKNLDYRDQIFYELAMLELKKPDQAKAIDYLKKSISNNTTNQRQKALSYYKIGQIYFYEIKNFKQAGVYFDSASASITKDAPEYREIFNISKTLKDFVRFSSTIHLQDSLLDLSSMGEKELIAYCQKLVEEKKKQEAEEAARQLEELNRLNDPGLNNDPFNQGGGNNKKKGFYFDQPDLVASGKVEFERVWGRRPNEDNWRRKNKEMVLQDLEDSGPQEAVVDSGLAKAVGKEVAQMVANVPKTPEAKEQSHLKIQEAYFGLGQIFKDRLGLPDSAIKTFNILLDRYPTGPYAMKAKFLLYKIYQEKDPSQAELIGDEICKVDPAGRYCKLVRNQIVEGEEGNSEFNSAYSALWNTFKEKDYKTCIDFSNFISSQFLSEDELANVYYIRGMSFGYLGNRDSLRQIFRYIRTNYPEAEITPTVNKTLALLDGDAPPSNDPEVNNTPNNTPTLNDPRFKDFSATPSPGDKFVVLIYIDKEGLASSDLQIKVGDFNKKYFNGESLNTSIFLYKNTHHLAYVSQFNSQNEAKAWMDLALKDEPLKSLMKKPTDRMVFITTSNFRTAYGKKRLEDYFAFFDTVLANGNGK